MRVGVRKLLRTSMRVLYNSTHASGMVIARKHARTTQREIDHGLWNPMSRVIHRLRKTAFSVCESSDAEQWYEMRIDIDDMVGTLT